MRPALRYALGVTVAMAALAQWWPHPAGVLVPAAVRHAAGGADQWGGLADLRAMPLPALPTQLAPIGLERAQRDPFVPWLASPPPTPAPKVAAAPPPVQTPAPAPALPSAPPQSLRYLGTMQTPTGNTVVMLANGDLALPVEPGTRLPNGYVVQSLGPNAVRLLYPPTATEVDLPIAAASAQRP
jgi:hypothetical protein